MPIPDHIPPLPSPQNSGFASWPANVVQSHKLLADLYGHALQALQTDVERPCLQYHAETIMNDAFSLILAFEQGEGQFPALSPWVQLVAQIFMEMLNEFQEAKERVPKL